MLPAFSYTTRIAYLLATLIVRCFADDLYKVFSQLYMIFCIQPVLLEITLPRTSLVELWITLPDWASPVYFEWLSID